MLKILKQDSETFKKLEAINAFLSEQAVEIHPTVYNGLIFKVDKNYFKYQIEDDCTDQLPPFFEGRYVLCDNNGNTDFYN